MDDAVLAVLLEIRDELRAIRAALAAHEDEPVEIGPCPFCCEAKADNLVDTSTMGQEPGTRTTCKTCGKSFGAEVSRG